ncbi:MAG: hypothetical protein K6U80_09160 [Firmicutes bacterium]|nr:hypothetical protein [Bacillota bacterium]
MIRKLMLIGGILLLAMSPAAQGAAQDFMRVSSNYSEMQKSLVWLTEGLSKLGNHKDAKLILTKAQKKKILPVFQALIDTRLVQLEIQDNRQGNGGANQRQGQGQRQWPGQGGNNQGGLRAFNQNDPQIQQRLKQMQEQIDFGNKQIDLIDGILTGAQVKFIDNMDFNEEKYGFLNFQRNFRNNGQNGGNAGTGQDGGQNGMNNSQGFNQQAFEEIREKMRAGQEALVKLNNAVLKMLKS